MVDTFRIGRFEGVMGLVLGVGFSAVFIVAGLVALVDHVLHSKTGSLLAGLPFFLGLCAGGVLLLRYVLLTCYQVRVWDDGRCEFRNVLHPIPLHVSQIISVKGVRDAYGDISRVKVQTTRGKLKLFEPTNGFAPFCRRLEELNGAVSFDFPSGYFRGVR